MIRQSPWKYLAPALLVCGLCAGRAKANDSAVETAAGGLQLKEERRVAIVKERLYVGKKLLRPDPGHIPIFVNRYVITVEYEFVNESNEDVTTEVGFPLPLFTYPWEDLIQDRRIHGFKVEVNGKLVPYATDVRAKANGQDVTDLLRESGIDIESFAHFDHNPRGPSTYQVERLPKETQARLKSAGAVDDELAPKWAVAVTYHWKQTFPARRVLRVRHEYKGIPGFSYSYNVREYLSEFKDGCFNDALTVGLEGAVRRAPKSEFGPMISGEWVKYILTTANTWKTPIRDFELIVEWPAGQFASFCWDGKLETRSDTRVRVTARDFAPQKELLVYFFSVGE